MKKTLLTLALLAGIAASVQAQGTISIDNLSNSGGPAATSGGLIYNMDLTVWNGAALNLVVLGGPNAGSLVPIATLVGANAALGAGGGLFLDPVGTTYAVPGVALSGVAVLQIQAWTGPALTYAAAYGNAPAAQSPTFNNPTGGGGSPPALPVSLTGMPSMILMIPEPSTFALLGLGALGMMIFRRK